MHRLKAVATKVLFAMFFIVSPLCFAQFETTLSEDGRYIAFSSGLSTWVANDTNDATDVFVLDTITNKTIRVSVDNTGNEGNGSSDTAVISANGKFVVFASEATNLAPDIGLETRGIYVHELQTGVTSRASVNSSGATGDYYSQGVAINADGRFVAFGSWADNLAANDTNTESDTFVHDRVTGTTTMVSVDSNGNAAVRARSGGRPSISSDGNLVAFTSGADNLVPDDTNDIYEVFVHNTQTGITSRVAVDNAGNEGNHWSSRHTFGGNGRYIAFTSLADNLVPGDTNETLDIFIRDLQQNTTTRVSVDSNGNQLDVISQVPVMSPDGRYVAFRGVTKDFKLEFFYVHDRQSGNTRQYYTGVVVGLSPSGFIHYLGHGWTPLNYDPVCPDPDGDGAGWNGAANCTPFAEDASALNDRVYDGVACIDTDGDGWGWQTPEKTPSRSCRSDSEDNTGVDIISIDPNYQYCIDTDGDGWGWSGQTSCRIGHTATGTCEDADGDFWGWDGTKSCTIPK